MMSQDMPISILASASGLPRSIVITVAMASVRLRSSGSGAHHLWRVDSGRVFPDLKTLAAAASASSRSAMLALATVPMVLLSAGLCTGRVEAATAARHSLLIRS